jgi:hypothetical protein
MMEKVVRGREEFAGVVSGRQISYVAPTNLGGNDVSQAKWLIVGVVISDVDKCDGICSDLPSL